MQRAHISSPRNLQKHLCIRTFVPKTSSEISVKIGQIVEVIHKHPSGWWFVYNYEQQGYVPGSHLIPMMSELDISENDLQKVNEAKELFVTTKPYNAQKMDEISLTANRHVEVLQKSDDGWWLVRCLDSVHSGLFPSVYLRAMNNTSSPFTKQLKVITASLKSDSCIRKPIEPLESKSSPADNSIIPSERTKIKDGTQHSTQSFQGDNDEDKYFIAVQSYEDLHGDSLSFCVGQLIKVIEKDDSGWWYAEVDGKYGWIPSPYFKKYKPTTGCQNSVPPLPNKPPRIKDNSLLFLLSSLSSTSNLSLKQRMQTNKCLSLGKCHNMKMSDESKRRTQCVNGSDENLSAWNSADRSGFTDRIVMLPFDTRKVNAKNSQSSWIVVNNSQNHQNESNTPPDAVPIKEIDFIAFDDCAQRANDEVCESSKI